MLIGRTNDLAWGATYSFLDGIDSWIEDCRDGSYRRVQKGRDRWVPFRVRTEVIRRKNASPTSRSTFHENDHGVLDGDPNEPGSYLATRWASGVGTGAASLAACFGMFDGRRRRDRHGPSRPPRARLQLGARRSPRRHRLPDVGLHAGPPQGWSGLVPVAGWDPENDWQGFVAPEDLPRARNPESGFLATANDDLNHLGKAQPINLPMGPYRAERIAALLAARDDWTVADVEAMQMDVLSPHAERFMAILRRSFR